MKTRALAFSLALVLALSLLSGCGDKGGNTSGGRKAEEEYEQYLETGSYAGYDEDDELAGYLTVSRKRLTLYDKDGNETDELKYTFDETDGIYYIDDEEAFTVEKSRKTLTLITYEDEDEYTLEAIDEEEIPIGGAAADSPESTDAPDAPEPTSDAPEPTPPAGERLLKAGCYALYDEDGDLVNYLKVTGEEFLIYYDDGDIAGELSYEYDPERDAYLTENGYTMTAESRGGALYLNDGDGEYRVEAIRESDIPVYTGGVQIPDDWAAVRVVYGSEKSLYISLPRELRDALDTDSDGTEAEAVYSSDSGGLYLMAMYAEGEDRREALEEALGEDLGDVSGEDLIRAVADAMDEELGELFDEMGIEPSSYTSEERINGSEWHLLNIYGYDDNVMDAYVHIYLDDDVLIMVVAEALALDLGDDDSDGFFDAWDLYLDTWLPAVIASYDVR